ncbi:hypothetical protein EVAR_34643_1 [Eumeta japonica]|uniref:Uncharacterized protein n=1 Tax=Eumeta variegata TaxID=151549 RepID=A0A4C1VFH6_EUMVA|nr:hypothetical protein EVAR_34643_1 [Eumeta japonica]
MPSAEGDLPPERLHHHQPPFTCTRERGVLAKKFSTPYCWKPSTLSTPKPLTEVDIEPTEAEGLTPNHFLIGRSCGAITAGHFDDNVFLGLFSAKSDDKYNRPQDTEQPLPWMTPAR